MKDDVLDMFAAVDEVIKNQETYEERRLLCEKISRDFYRGYMTYCCYRLIDKCILDFGFDYDVVYALFANAYRSHVQNSAKAIEQTAVSWRRHGLKTKEDFEKYFSELFPDTASRASE